MKPIKFRSAAVVGILAILLVEPGVPGSGGQSRIQTALQRLEEAQQHQRAALEEARLAHAGVREAYEALVQACREEQFEGFRPRGVIEARKKVRSAEKIHDEVDGLLRAARDRLASAFRLFVPEAGPAPPPVHAWSFNEGAGGLAADGAGSLDGLLQGPAWGEGHGGTSGLWFDGDGDYVAVGGSVELAQLTVAAWVRPAAGDINNHRIFTLDDGVTQDYYHFGIETMTTRSLEITAGSIRFNLSEVWVLEPEVWNHVAVSVDGSRIRVYLNGQLSKEGAFPFGPRRGAVYLGGVPQPQHLAQAWEGALDEVQLFDRALDDAQVLSVYLQTPGN